LPYILYIFLNTKNSSINKVFWSIKSFFFGNKKNQKQRQKQKLKIFKIVGQLIKF
jgi:hypothetical protein